MQERNKIRIKRMSRFWIRGSDTYLINRGYHIRKAISN